MSPNRNWFSTYRSIEGRVILMGNDSQLKAIGIGTVELRCMWDEGDTDKCSTSSRSDKEPYLPWHSKSKVLQVLSRRWSIDSH